MTANTHQHGAAITADGTLLVVGTGPIAPAVDEGPSLTVRNPGGEEKVVPLDGPHEDVAVSKDAARPMSPEASRATAAGTASRSSTWTPAGRTGSRRAGARWASQSSDPVRPLNGQGRRCPARAHGRGQGRPPMRSMSVLKRLR